MDLPQPYTQVSASFSVCKACTPIHLWILYTSTWIHHQVPEGTTRPYSACPAPPAPHPWAPFSPHGSQQSLLHPGCYSPVLSLALPLRSTLSFLCTQFISWMDPQEPTSICPFLVSLAGLLPWLFICCAWGCQWSCCWYLVLPTLWACSPWRRHSLWCGHPLPLALRDQLSLAALLHRYPMS